MIVKMKQTQKGSPNGIDVVTYEKDQEYEINGRLADIFVNEIKVAVKVADFKEKSVKPAINKAMDETPKNKDADPEDKKDKKNKKDEKDDKK